MAIDMMIDQASGLVTAASATPHLAVVAGARATGRYLPVDALDAATTTGAAAVGGGIGPRSRYYGRSGAWLAAEQPEGSQRVVWQTVPLPPAERTLVAAMWAPAQLLQLLGRLPDRTSGLVALEILDPGGSDWLGAGGDEGERAPFTVVARLEGSPEAVARAHRGVFQAMELAGGKPRAWGGDRARLLGPVLPDLAAAQGRLAYAAAPAAVADLMGLAAEAVHTVGGGLVRGHGLDGVVRVALKGPAEPVLEEWLTAQAYELGARPHRE